MMISTITSRGQITIPQDIRELLNISAGDKVVFEMPSGAEQTEIPLRVVKTKDVVEALFGSLKDSHRRYTPINQAREQAYKALSKERKIK